jgi:hypothetical protein
MIPRGRTAVLLALLSVVGAPAAAQQADAARFNGTWEWRLGNMEHDGASGEFRIWALDERRLQVEFQGLFAYKTGTGRTGTSGEASGVAIVKHGEATFQPEVEERDCRFTLRLRLRGDQMVVSRESGDTCFGFNVTAEGTYRHVSTDRPTFEFTDPADAEAPVKRDTDRPDDMDSRTVGRSRKRGYALTRAGTTGPPSPKLLGEGCWAGVARRDGLREGASRFLGRRRVFVARGTVRAAPPSE